MIWKPADDRQLEQKGCVLLERLYCDRGVVKGSVAQYTTGGPAYGFTADESLGDFPNIAAAKKAVEDEIRGRS